MSHFHSWTFVRSFLALAAVSASMALSAAQQPSPKPQVPDTVIFEPAALKLHLAFGKGPASKLPLKELDLTPLLKLERGEKWVRRLDASRFPQPPHFSDTIVEGSR